MIVRAKPDGDVHPSLTRGQSYFVVGIEADDYRIINDHGDPCLYEPEMFDLIDTREPGDWVKKCGEEGERYAYPPRFNEAGFFEDYHDRQPQAVSEFWRYVNELLTRSV